MAIAFPTTFASQSGNLAASTLDANFTYTGTLPSQATTITSVSYTLTGAETVLINAGATPYSATIQQITSALGVGTAVKLQTARTISTTGDVTYTSGGFDGTANVTGTATVISASTSTPGKVQLAQASDVTAGTSTTLAVTPSALANGLVLNPKACVRWTGQTSNGACTILKSYNVTSVTRTGGGAYTIAFTNNLSDANYVINATVQLWSGGSMMVGITYGTTPGVGSFQITSTDLSNTGRDVSIYCCTVFD